MPLLGLTLNNQSLLKTEHILCYLYIFHSFRFNLRITQILFQFLSTPLQYIDNFLPNIWGCTPDWVSKLMEKMVQKRMVVGNYFHLEVEISYLVEK